MTNPLGVVGLNPSITKDGKNLTVSALSKIAKREGFDSLFITNLYSYITPDPKQLKKIDKPVLQENDDWIQRMATTCKKILCIWGNNPEDYLMEMVNDDNITKEKIELAEEKQEKAKRILFKLLEPTSLASYYMERRTVGPLLYIRDT